VAKEKIIYRGNVKATQAFRTRGRLVCVVYQRGQLRYLYHEDGAFKRENDSTVVPGQLDPELRYRITGDTTILGKRQRLLVFDGDMQRVDTDTYGPLSMFDANGSTYFWIQNGQLGRKGQLGFEYIGDVLAGRTLFWSGEKFGLGFYQAGQLMRTFVFDTSGRGLNDQVNIPAFPGQLVDSTCAFSDRLAWFFATLQLQGRLENRCYAINDRGEVVAQATVNQEEDSWLAGGIRGRFAAGTALFVPTDRGIVRVEPDHGSLRVMQEFPDTEPFVDGTSHLLSGDGGIYVVSGDSREITLVTIK
jgi:H/ACA ribonucleoprotein complex subunit 3